MSIELIIGAAIICVCVVGLFMAITRHFEPEAPRHGAQPLTGAGPKPAMKKKPVTKEMNSSDWDGDGSI